ncbi:flavin reductase family protein [Mesorhizobium sp. 1B3]|uniref:flavin reductase family protein n=1 Tax=Mesorhizobium sp. 1B3 TaxID=3243599 RepID=UPI003D961D2C
MDDNMNSTVFLGRGSATREFDPANLSTREQYKLLTGSIVPRPIALVTTLGSAGVNAAPFSFFNVVGVAPPTIMLSIGMRGEELEKDTLRNLRAVPEFVVHIVHEDEREAMQLCAGYYPPEVNETELAGFEVLPSRKVRPPRIARCPAQFECVVKNIIPVGAVPYHMVLGEIVAMHFGEDIVSQNLHVDLDRLSPLGRLAGPASYVRLSDRLSLAPVD